MVCSNKYCSFDHDLSSNPNLIVLTTPHSHSTYVHDIICT
ncbi:9196_t:CDS:2 [Rhizophagus irregularis]|nr:9196_t:CDS:2 [Rhizophagus irregularis]